MKLDVQPGKYVVAVSGGVDSMVLLDMLTRMHGLALVVAHFEHGIREDSDLDRELVQRAATRYGLPFIYEHGKLGPHASEAVAREARYTFLCKAKEQTGARAIITAHHQDDLIETAVINILRGTGRKGLSSLRSNNEIVRPLLNVTKARIYDYAAKHQDVTWRTDSTNNSDQYLRNYVRTYITKKLDEASRASLLQYIQKASETNPILDIILVHALNDHTKDGQLDRRWFVMQPHDVSRELMAAWLRQQAIRDFDRKAIERLVVGAKVAAPGKSIEIHAGYLLKVGKTGLRVVKR